MEVQISHEERQWLFFMDRLYSGPGGDLRRALYTNFTKSSLGYFHTAVITNRCETKLACSYRGETTRSSNERKLSPVIEQSGDNVPVNGEVVS